MLAFLVIVYAISHNVANNKLHNWIDHNDNISVNNTRLNLFFGNLSFESVKFKDEMYATETCTIKSIQISGVSFFDYLFKNEINIDEIALSNAELFLNQPQPNKDTANQIQRNFRISKLTTDNLNLKYSSKKYELQVQQANIELTDFTNDNKNHFADIELSAENMSYKPAKGVHDYLTEKIELSSTYGVFKTNNLTIQPRCSEDDWPSCFPNNKSRLTYKAKSITGKLDDKPLSSGIFLKKLEIDNGLLSVFSYQEMEVAEIPKTFFMEKFDKLKIPINIPIIEVKNHKVEVLLKVQDIDTISFDQIYATFDNVTNTPDALRKNNNINVATISKFMDAGLKVDFDFKIKDPLNAYAFKLELDPMAFTKLNKAINYNTPFVIQEGKLQQLDCEVTGNALASNGQCAIAYDGLLINFGRESDGKKKFLTKLINFVIKDGTGKPGRLDSEIRVSTLERENDKDFFYHAYSLVSQIIRDAMLPI